MNPRADLEMLVVKRCWSPRSEFPPSTAVSSDIFRCGDDIYLLTNPDVGADDPVWAVGWADSEYWARRSWEVPFNGDLTSPPFQHVARPSLVFLGRPKDLGFKSVCEYERRQQGAKRMTLIVASHRMTDGGFLYTKVQGSQGVTYMYPSVSPKAEEEPVAIEISLPD